MNKNRHRIIFNAARGQRMVVAENASSAGGSASGETSTADSVLAPLAPLGDLDICKPSRLRNVALHPLTLSIALAFTLGLVFYTTAHAQIVADPSAPGNQRPTILQAGNGATVVNIQTPSAAGVSRNVYGRFDVDASGAILNNSRTNVQTQIGGWISGNPWVGAPARVILNEVNSSNPSYLNGPLEVAGQRAEVIVANPSGIRVNGGTFLNASGVSVAEQSGLKAGDGGFQVNVNGNTELIGGAIASNQRAVDEGKNRFGTGGELSTTDIRNEARYSASSTSVGVGTGSVGQNLAMNGLGAGVGRDSGNASSTTTAGISGIAGDKAIRSTDAETGIQRIFDKETVQKEIAAQTLITETFSREAPKAVASYAGAQQRALTQQLRDETDPVKQEALQVEIDKWKEGGVYRVALHTAAGALGGGLGGAAGAAVSGASANLMNAWQDNIEQSLIAAGMSDTAAKSMAQGVTRVQCHVRLDEGDDPGVVACNTPVTQRGAG
ncbi:two-partner secretion domain-containing protein, partial [Hydrogenophaga laconesensis]